MHETTQETSGTNTEQFVLLCYPMVRRFGTGAY